MTYTVTNLNDSGAGSLRYGLEDSSDSSIVLSAGLKGTITLSSRIWVERSDFTMDLSNGAVQIKGYGIIFQNCDNIIVKHLRSRPGNDAEPNVNDAVTCYENANNILFQNCSFQYSQDELASTYGHHIKFEECIFAYPFYYGYVFLLFDGSTQIEFEHCLFAHCHARAPFQIKNGYMRFKNNVVYNNSYCYMYPSAGAAFVDIVGNYFDMGNGTDYVYPYPVIIGNSTQHPYLPQSRICRYNNHLEGNYTAFYEDYRELRKNDSFLPLCNTDCSEGPLDAHTYVLANAGAWYSGSRDTLDQGIVDDATNGTGDQMNLDGSEAWWPDLTLL